MSIAEDASPIAIVCQDETVLRGHLWRAPGNQPDGIVIINPATGVLARYYHRYARFLIGVGFDVVTYDYRGIGLSRPARLRGCRYRWRDWGDLDFEAAVQFAGRHRRAGKLLVVGHSFGGVIPGLAKNGAMVERMLTVGAQYAYWRDYAPEHRLRLFLKWHVAMPALTLLFGYFPGRRLGWLEDLPAGVANEWSFKPARMEQSYAARCQNDVLQRLASCRAQILAVVVSDDELGMQPGVRRALFYYRNAVSTEVVLSPSDLGVTSIGHFGLFHAKFTDTFWIDSVHWLRHGNNPWCDRSSRERTTSRAADLNER